MNKILAKLVAAGLVAVSLAAVACNAQKTPSQLAVNTPDAVSDASPTPAELISQSPTEIPTPTAEPTPTPEPTATPLPEGWIIDPTGNIPQNIEILGLDNGITFRTCISTKAGKYYCQTWDDGEILWECEVPRELAEDSPKLFGYGETEYGIYVMVDHDDGTETIYHKTEKGVFLMRGIPGAAVGGKFELLIAPKTLVWFNLHWDSYYYQKTYPKEIEYLEGYNLWVWAGTEELIPVNFEQSGEKINFPQ